MGEQIQTFDCPDCLSMRQRVLMQKEWNSHLSQEILCCAESRRRIDAALEKLAEVYKQYAHSNAEYRGIATCDQDSAFVRYNLRCFEQKQRFKLLYALIKQLSGSVQDNDYSDVSTATGLFGELQADVSRLYEFRGQMSRRVSTVEKQLQNRKMAQEIAYNEAKDVAYNYCAAMLSKIKMQQRLKESSAESMHYMQQIAVLENGGQAQRVINENLESSIEQKRKQLNELIQRKTLLESMRQYLDAEAKSKLYEFAGCVEVLGDQ